MGDVATVNAVPAFGGLRQDEAFRAASDFELAVNCDLGNGVAEGRPGWRVCRSVATWSPQDDAAGVERYVPDTYQYLAWESRRPLGAHVFAGPDGVDYVLSVTAPDVNPATNPPRLAIWTTAAKRVNGGLPNAAGAALSYPGSAVNDAVDHPYTFSQFGHWVYFCNGGNLYRWNWHHPHVQYVTHGNAFYRHPRVGSALLYLLEMRGARLTCCHEGVMVYAGFDAQFLSCEEVVDVNQDGLITKADFDENKDGFTLGPGNISVQVNPYTLVLSDTGLPRCCQLQNFRFVAANSPPTALASFNRMLVVWSADEMFVFPGNVYGPWQKVSEGVGCVAQRTVATTRDGLLLWLARDGIYGWDGSGRPQKLSDPLDRMFRDGDEVDPPATVPSVTASSLGLPHRVRERSMKWASAAVHPTGQYYACALSVGTTSEDNNVVVCLDWKTKRTWLWSGRPAQSDGDPTRTAVVGHFTLMASRNQPNVLFTQGYSLVNPQAAPASRTHNTCISVADAVTDQVLSFAGGLPVVAYGSYDMLLVTGRMFWGDSGQKVPRRLFLRMFATRRDDFLLLFPAGRDDVNKIQLVYMPEHAHFDRQDQLTTSTREFVTVLRPWPDQFRAYTYFWQGTTFTDPTVGRWDNGTTAADKFWQGTMLFDQRVDLKADATQFFRVALWKRVDSDSGPSLRLVSMGVGLLPGAAQR